MASGWYDDEHPILVEGPSVAIEIARFYGIQERLAGFQYLWNMKSLGNSGPVDDQA